MADEDAPVFRKPARKNKGNMRARPSEADEAEAATSSDVVRPTKQAKPNPLHVSTHREGSASTKSLVAELVHGSDRRISQYDNKATATNEQDVDRSADAQAQYEAARAMWDDGKDVAADGSRVYRGQKAYRQYTAKSESFDNQVMSGAGPARAPVHYRASSLFDYKPDICKDYKDTGFCGFGDACKFLHDRSDYKSGWQLEKQWEDEQRAKTHAAALKAFEEGEGGGSSAAGGASTSTADDPADRLPFACLICREPWHAKSNPVVTKCEHYFCESCALKHAAKTKRCFVCAENTGGIFNTSKLLAEKIEKQKWQAKLAEEVEAGGALTDEQVLQEYEAEQKKQQRGFTGGWGIV